MCDRTDLRELLLQLEAQEKVIRYTGFCLQAQAETELAAAEAKSRLQSRLQARQQGKRWASENPRGEGKRGSPPPIDDDSKSSSPNSFSSSSSFSDALPLPDPDPDSPPSSSSPSLVADVAAQSLLDETRLWLSRGHAPTLSSHARLAHAYFALGDDEKCALALHAGFKVLQGLDGAAATGEGSKAQETPAPLPPNEAKAIASLSKTFVRLRDRRAEKDAANDTIHTARFHYATTVDMSKISTSPVLYSDSLSPSSWPSFVGQLNASRAVSLSYPLTIVASIHRLLSLIGKRTPKHSALLAAVEHLPPNPTFRAQVMSLSAPANPFPVLEIHILQASSDPHFDCCDYTALMAHLPLCASVHLTFIGFTQVGETLDPETAPSMFTRRCLYHEKGSIFGRKMFTTCFKGSYTDYFSSHENPTLPAVVFLFNPHKFTGCPCLSSPSVASDFAALASLGVLGGPLVLTGEGRNGGNLEADLSVLLTLGYGSGEGAMGGGKILSQGIEHGAFGCEKGNREWLMLDMQGWSEEVGLKHSSKEGAEGENDGVLPPAPPPRNLSGGRVDLDEQGIPNAAPAFLKDLIKKGGASFYNV